MVPPKIWRTGLQLVLARFSLAVSYQSCLGASTRSPSALSAPSPPSYSNYANSQVEIVNRLLRARRVLVGFLAACARVKRFARLYVVPHYRYKPGNTAGFKRARAEFEAASGTATDSKRHKEKEAEAQAGATEGGGADDE